MKCAGGGEGSYELSCALPVHVIKLSAFRSTMRSSFLAQKCNRPYFFFLFLFVFYFSNFCGNTELTCSQVLYITTSVCFKEINCYDT